MRVLFIAILIFAAPAWGELRVFDVRKNLRLSDGEPVYHDYYISGGTEQGLTAGSIITVTRRTPLYDSYQNQLAGDLQLKVAKVKIIHAQKGLAVARLHSEFNRENAPLLDDAFVMIGDTLDLTTATGEARTTAAAEPVEPALVDAKPVEAKIPDSKPLSAPVAQIKVNAVVVSPKPTEAAPVAGDKPKL